MNIRRNTLAFAIAAVLFLASASASHAQQSTWQECRDGRSIVRCETYDCPQGDTNRDGQCTLTDTGARLTDARNDSFCANPISGCGQVHYFPTGSSNSCLVRVEETQQNCNLYAVATPTFTPQPTATSRPTATPTSTATSSGAPIAGKGGLNDKELPETGAEHVFLGFGILLLGAAGVFLYEKHKTV